MKTILTSLLILSCLSTFGAVPIISYSGGAKVYLAGTTITPLVPTNTGDPVTTPATVTTFVAAAGGQSHGMAFNSDYSFMYTGLKNVYRVGKVTMSAGTSVIFAGNGTGFNDATGTAALFAAPYGTAVHPITGDIYVADQANNRIRKITTSGVVTTFAGNGTPANVDGAIASSQFNNPVCLAFDTDGTLYVLTYGSSAIRKISANGSTVSTIISNIGTTTYHFAYKNGYFYVSDIGTSTNKIYKISLALGTKTVLAGSGTASSLDGTGVAATFNGPRGIAVDDYGFVYVNDYGSNKIRRITPDGVVTTFAGSGTGASTDGTGTAAAFKSNAGLTFDGSGNLYVGDAGSNSIRKVTVNPFSISPALPAGLIFDGTTGTISGTPKVDSPATNYTITATNASGSATTTVNITTVYKPGISYTGSPLTYTVSSAITPLTPTNAGGAVPATNYGTVTTPVASAGGQPHGMAFNADYSLMYTGLKSVYLVGKVTMSLGTSATLAGTGATGSADGTGAAASFATPYGTAVHPITGDIYVADQGNNTIRRITIGGVVTTFAGINGTAGSLDGAISSATFNGPCGLAFDADGTLYVLQSGSSKIRKIDAAGTTVSTIASYIGTNIYHFAYSNGYFYVSDTGTPSSIYKVALADGTKTTLAGSGAAGYADGTGTAASFSAPRGIVVDGSGNVYVNDYTNNRIRMITPAGVVTTVAGNGTNTSTDGVGTAATFALPAGLVMDNAGNLYVGDAATSKIRKVVVTGYTIKPALPAGLSFDGTTGIISGTPTVTSAATNYTITAFNGGGSSSATVNIKTVTVPGAPASVTATAGNTRASVAFTAPASDGGATITNYTVTSSPGGLTASGTASPLTVNGLTNGTAYTFTVTATNSAGTGSGTTSGSVTPDAIANNINVSTSTSVGLLTLTPVSDMTVENGATLSVDVNTNVNSMTATPGSKINFTTANTLSITGDLLLKADQTNSFSANIGSGTLAVTGAIKYLRTIDASKWYFMAFPSDVTIAQITATNQTLGTLGTDWFIKYYDGAKRGTYGAGSNWISITAADVTADPTLKLHQYQGYIIGLANGKPVTELSFPLDKSVVSTEPSNRNISVAANNAGTISNTNFGWNLIGQPYLSNFTESNTTGTFNIYISDGVGIYTPYTQATVPTLNPMSAYFIQASTTLAGTGITFNTAGRQLVNSVVATNYSSDKVQLNLSSPTGTDYALLNMDNNFSNDYEIGYDFEKWIGTGTDKPQVYTQLNGINYAFNDLPMSSVNNLPLGFYTKTAGITTISAITAQTSSLSKLLLTDNGTNPATVTDLLLSDYSFTAAAGSDSTRFVLTAQRISTGNIIETDTNGPTLLIDDSKLIINNLSNKSTVRVFDAIGRMVANKPVNNNRLEIQLPVKGMYAIQIESGIKNWTKKIVNQ